MQIDEVPFLGQTAIAAYGGGGFRFADVLYSGSVLCLPSGIYAWNPAENVPVRNDLTRVVREAGFIEVFLIGTGQKMRNLPCETASLLHTHNISFEVMNTGAAARSFNVLLSENRAVAAALYAVD